MSEQNGRRKAKEDVAIRDDFQLRKIIRQMRWSRVLAPGIAAGLVEWPPENSEWIQMARWLFEEANSTELLAVAKAIKKDEMRKPAGGELDSRLAKESYLEARAALVV